VTTLLVFPAVGNAQAAPPVLGHAQVASHTEPICSSYISTAGVTALTGLTSQVYYAKRYPASFGYQFPNSLGGSACSWIATVAPYTCECFLDNDAFVFVDYGQSAQDRKKTITDIKEGGYFAEIGPVQSASLGDKLGPGTLGFVDTLNLWSVYSAAAPFPEYLYVVAVLTRHHDVLEVAFLTASKAKTEAWVSSKLSSDASL
jgi:hypothetical protein